MYVLRLEQNKWYIGITSQTPEKRLWEHQNNIRPANWTRKYTPIGIHYSEDLGVCSKAAAELYENRITRKYIKKYGLKNVRGGDLRTTENLVQGFGHYWVKDDLVTAILVTFMTLVILYLGFMQ